MRPLPKDILPGFYDYDFIWKRSFVVVIRLKILR